MKGFFILLIVFIGCTKKSSESWLKEGQTFYIKGQTKKAEESFVQLMRRHPESVEAIQGAMQLFQIYMGKNPPRFSESVRVLRFVIHRSEKMEDILKAQKLLAQVYTEHQSDYKNGVIEWRRYIEIEKDKGKKQEARLILARTHFFSQDYFQSLSEISVLLESKPDGHIKFQTIFLRGRVYFSQKKLDQAIEDFETLLKTFPKESLNENVAMTLAVAYEEQGSLSEAIRVWKKIRRDKKELEFVSGHIQKLERRRRALPRPNKLKK